MSVKQYLNAPGGAVYGFAPTPPRSFWESAVGSPRTAVPGLYLASAYVGFGGYSGVVQSARACADLILRES
jgi:phytoene dehydrogenase-like protein